MHRLSTTAVAGMLALTIAGCNSGGEETSNANVQPTVATQTTDSSPEPSQAQSQPVIVAQKPDNTQKENKENKSQDQKSSQKTPPVAAATAGLIQPTNPNQRTQQVQKGRPDPFAELYDPQPQVAAAPKPKPPSIPVTPVLKPAPLPPPMPVAPPQPDLARSTTVLGVVEVGNQFQAIVQVPNEATSRYVSEGQRLADGQVTVKRIEMYPGSEPVVILEQFGQEVSRAVGQEPAQANTGTIPGAPGKTSSAISVPSVPPTSGSIPGIGGQNALPPSPPVIEPAASNQQPKANSSETPSPEDLKNRLKTAQPQDDSNIAPQSSSESQPAVQTKTYLPTVQPAATSPEEIQPTSEVTSQEASPQSDDTSETLPSDESLPASEGDDVSQMQSSTGLPSAQQSKQRLVALLTRSQLANSNKTAVQSNSKARMYRQELINRLLKSN
jgi:hypothetical protein